MAINNTYVLEVDMKRQMTQRVPKFRKGDSGILIFKLFDDGMEYDISSVTKAELYHKTSKGNIIESKCDFIQYEGKRAIRYVYEAVAMVETGINETLLVVYEGDKTVSIQPFPVVIYDDFKGGAGSFVELIQELQNKINGLVMDLTQTIKLAEKGKPNGVATLDSSGKIPFAQLPSQIDAYIDHIKHTVWKNQVHGLRLNDDGILQYKTSNGSWQNVGFAEDALGGGGAGTQLLDVEIAKNNGVVTLTYKGLPTVQLQKIAKGDFEKSYFLTNGSTFTGTSFAVTELGLYTLYYKDSNGNDYIRLFNIEVSHLPTPTVSVTINNGDATVNINSSISIKKWAKGSQTIAYFQSQGTVFTGNTFVVDSVGVYTIYYKTTAGVEYVYEFNVTSSMLKKDQVASLPQYTEFTIGSIKAILLEPDTGLVIIPKWATDKFDNAGLNTYSATTTSNVGYRLNNTSNPFYQSLLSNGMKEEDILLSEWGIGKVDISEERVPNDTTPPSWYERVRNIEMSSKVTAKIGLISFTQYTKHHSFYTNTGKLTDYIGWTLTPYRTTSNPNPSPPQVYGPSENPQYGLTMVPASTYGWVSPTFYLSQDAKIIDGKYVGNEATSPSIDATISLNPNSSQKYISIRKPPVLTNNTGGTVIYNVKISDNPNPELEGTTINTSIGSNNFPKPFSIQELKQLIPNNTSTKLYYHYKITHNNSHKWFTEEVSIGYDAASTTTTLSNLSVGELFRIDGYNDGHFVKLTSGSSNVMIMHIPSSDIVYRKWGTTTQGGSDVGYGFQLDAGIGQHLNTTYLDQLPTTLKNSIIEYTYKQHNPVNTNIIEKKAKVAFMEEEFAVSQVNDILPKTGAHILTTLTTRDYPDYVWSYGGVSMDLYGSAFMYISNLNYKNRDDMFTPVFVLGSTSSISVRKVSNATTGILK